jgi:hypothetical protein
MKKLVIVILLICSPFYLGSSHQEGKGCEQTTTDDIQRQKTEKMLGEAQRQVGMPNIVNWQQRRLMKSIFELCDQENLICYAYIKSDYQGKLMFIGKCVGFGIPFSAQFTNPMKEQWSSLALPQADPNGLFMPTSSSATWLMMVDPKTGKSRPVYIEPEIVVSPFPLHK